MAKFDYRKWVTENKHGIINEQINPIGNPPNSASFCPSGTDFNAQLCNGGFPTGANWGASASDEWIQGCCTGSLDSMPGSMTGSVTGSDGNYGPFCCNINAMNFGQMGNGQPYGASLGEPEQYIMMYGPQGPMCNNSICQGNVNEPGPEGMPSMMKKRPQKRMPQRKRPTRGLREVKNIIRKLIKEQGPSVAAPIGTHGSGVSTTGRYVVVRPCNHSPNGSTTIFPIMANMTIDGVSPQVGDVFFLNKSSVNLSGNGITGGQQSKWEVIETFPAANSVSTTYDRPSVSCDQEVYGYGNYPNTGQNTGKLVYYRCAVSNQYSQTPGVSQGCLPTTSGPFNTLAECEATGCAPGTVNDPDGDGVADMIRPKKMQAPVKDKMPMKRGATTKPSMPNRQMPMKENNLLEELKKDLKRKK